MTSLCSDRHVPIAHGGDVCPLCRADVELATLRARFAKTEEVLGFALAGLTITSQYVDRLDRLVPADADERAHLRGMVDAAEATRNKESSGCAGCPVSLRTDEVDILVRLARRALNGADYAERHRPGRIAPQREATAAGLETTDAPLPGAGPIVAREER